MALVGIMIRIVLGVTFVFAAVAHGAAAVGRFLPSGGEIAFVSDRRGNEDIYLIDLSRRLLPPIIRSAGDDRQPAWSPNGQRLAFFSDREGTWNLYIVNDSGGQLRRVSGWGTNYRAAAWSPDSRRLAFTSSTFEPDRQGTNYVHIASIDDEATVDIVISVGRLVYNPVWSLDGSRIRFDVLMPDGGASFSVRSDGTGLRAETDDAILWGPSNPLQLPEGLRLSSFVTGRFTDICVFDTDGQNRRCLSGGRGRNVDPAWRPSRSGPH